MRRALGVVGLAQAISFVTSFAGVIVVSRLLTPEEIGVFSVSVAFLGFAHIFREFGVSQYLIRAGSVGREQLRAAFSVALMTSWAMALVLYLLGKPLSLFYGHAGVAEVLALLSINFLIMPFGTPLVAMIQRDLQFGKLARATIAGAVAHAVVTIAAALMEASYLSMAYGAIASHVVKTTVLNFMRPGELFMLPGVRGVGDVLRFGSVAGLGAIVREAGASAPDLVLGRTLGFAEVAFFSRAVGLRRMLMAKVVMLVSSVYFPNFSKSVREGGDAAALYARSMNYMVAVTAPALLFLAIMAEPLILFLFGEQWTRSVPLATLLCLYACFTTPFQMHVSTLTAVNRVGLILRGDIIVQCLHVGVLMTSIWLSLEQVVMLMVLAYGVEAVVLQRLLKVGLGLSFGCLMREVTPALRLLPFAALGPLAALAALQQATPGPWVWLLALLAGGALSAGGWLAGVFLTGHAMADEIRLIVRKVLRRSA